jgi:hypothetical protein
MGAPQFDGRAAASRHRAGLPGPSRRITVEPVKAPPQRPEEPDETPPVPVPVPEREPVPTP